MPTHRPFIHSGASLALQTQPEPDSSNRKGVGRGGDSPPKAGLRVQGSLLRCLDCPVSGSRAESLRLGHKATHTKELQHLHKGVSCSPQILEAWLTWGADTLGPTLSDGLKFNYP